MVFFLVVDENTPAVTHHLQRWLEPLYIRAENYIDPISAICNIILTLSVQRTLWKSLGGFLTCAIRAASLCCSNRNTWRQNDWLSALLFVIWSVQQVLANNDLFSFPYSLIDVFIVWVSGIPNLECPDIKSNSTLFNPKANPRYKDICMRSELKANSTCYVTKLKPPYSVKCKHWNKSWQFTRL